MANGVQDITIKKSRKKVQNLRNCLIRLSDIGVTIIWMQLNSHFIKLNSGYTFFIAHGGMHRNTINSVWFCDTSLRFPAPKPNFREDAVSGLKDPRVLFAAERTLLAWNRTSLSLIAFGFVVERAGKLVRAISPGIIGPDQLAAMFWLGLAFIMLGAITSAYSARQYAIVLKTLTPDEFPPGYTAKWGLVVNLAVAALGVILALALWHWRLH